MLKYLFSVMVLAALLGGQASAQEEGRRGSLFISPCGRPYRAAPGEPYPVAVWFKQTDRDHDGFIERGERVGAAPYGLLVEPEPVTAADTEFNGRITLAEFLAAADRRFDILDVKQTGRIAFEDLPKTAVQTRPGGRERRRGDRS